MERVQRKLDHYFTYRTVMPDLFLNRDPTSPEIKNLKDQLLVLNVEDDIDG